MGQILSSVLPPNYPPVRKRKRPTNDAELGVGSNELPKRRRARTPKNNLQSRASTDSSTDFEHAHQNAPAKKCEQPPTTSSLDLSKHKDASVHPSFQISANHLGGQKKSQSEEQKHHAKSDDNDLCSSTKGPGFAFPKKSEMNSPLMLVKDSVFPVQNLNETTVLSSNKSVSRDNREVTLSHGTPSLLQPSSLHLDTNPHHMEVSEEGRQRTNTSFLDMAGFFDDEDDSSCISMTGDKKLRLNSYRVSPELSHILAEILDKHGDIAKDCLWKSETMRSAALEIIVRLAHELEKCTWMDVPVERLNTWYDIVKDVEYSKINVTWLRDKLFKVAVVQADNAVRDALEACEEARLAMEEADALDCADI